MTKVTVFSKKNLKGFCIGTLPMPDGTCRAYKEFGRNAHRIIINKWQAERADMLMALERLEA